MKNKFIFLVLMLFSVSSWPADIQREGKVVKIIAVGSFYDSDTMIVLEGVGGIAGCEVTNFGTQYLTKILIPAAEDRIYSLVLSAYMAGKTIGVVFDDELLKGTTCTIKSAWLSTEL